MVVSCLTIYAIAFSCFTLLIGKTFADAPVYVNVDSRQNDKRGNKIHIHNPVKTSSSASSKTNEKLFSPLGEVKVLQSYYQPSNTVKVKRLSNHSVKELNQTHSYFALFDLKNNVTKKFSSSNKYYSPMTISGSDINNNYESESKMKVKHQNNKYENIGFKKGKIKNFIVWDTLQDSEKEVRVHYNGITAKETAVRTGKDESTGKSEGLKLRQLTDGIHFIQLIYNFDNQVQDCEYLKLKTVIRKFLNTFRKDVEIAKINYENQEGEGDGGETEENKIDVETSFKEDDEDYLEEDEGKIEQYLLDEEEYEGEALDNEYRNVTFQIISNGEELPVELAAWMNYPKLKKQCRENQKIFKALAFDRQHGDEKTKKLAEEHIERKKRDLTIIFPGTQWCGKSNTAEKYTHLGGFFKTDKCCRAHDHCRPQINAFQTKFEFFNLRPFTVSHCKCDRRRKRDIADVLLVPGTKWCGKGRTATKYTSLGGFSRTDKCCRVHDTMCPHWIGGLQKKYGLFNWRINTIMHCRCDKRFRACLKMAKTGTANFVGKLFFNVVQTKCFVLKPKEVCLKYSRWGKCEKKEFRKQAHLKDNLQY